MVLSFREGDYLLKEYEAGDETAILSSFNRIFGALFRGFEPRSLEYWRWQYLANPSGRHLVSAFTPDGTVVAHHGFILQRLRTGSGLRRCGQVVDTMVDPAHRRGLQRTSLSALLSNRFVAHFGGEAADKVAFFWGAPIRVAMRVGESQGSYEVVRTQQKLVAPLAASAGDSGSGDVAIEPIATFGDEFDALFERLAPGYDVIAVRDAAQLNWRYRDRPGGDYRIAAARRGGLLVGYAVFSAGHFDGRDNQGRICDLFVGLQDEDARRALLAWLHREGAAAGVEQLAAILPDSCPEWHLLQEHGFRARPTGYPIVSWTCARRFDPEWLRWNWFYSLGDTDLV
ncbi:MAG: GNAT family N-acetyltransferase [Planctomycetes bacterium]|nr:GNAT family N-acetyltransferase [Planctomycetota bacterium]